MRASCACFALVLLSVPSARAQTRSESLSEREFTTRYRAAEPRLRAAGATIERAEAEVSLARRLANPAVAVERESVGDVDETTAGLALSLDLGGRSARIDGARSRVTAARAQAAHDRAGLVLDALGAYYGAVRARDAAALLEAARAPLAELVELSRLQAKAGESAGYDRERLELELARYDERLAEAQGDYAIARRSLGALLGEPGLEVVVTATLEVTPPAPLGTGLSDRRADLRAARARRSAAQHAAKAAGRWWIPAVGLSGGVKTVTAGGDSATGYSVGLSVEMPIFDRDQSSAREAAAALQRAQAEVDWLSAEVPASVSRAHATLVARLERLDGIDREQVARAERLVARATLRYREGEGEIVELVDAYRTALEIRERRLEVQYQAKRAELELAYALGGDSEGSDR